MGEKRLETAVWQKRAVQGFYGAAIGGVFGVCFLFAPLAAPNPALWYSLYLGWLGGLLGGGGALADMPILSLPAFLIYGAVSGAGLRAAALVLAGLHYLSAYVALGVKVSGSVREPVGPALIVEAFLAGNSAVSMIVNLLPFMVANVLYFRAALGFRGRFDHSPAA